MDYSDGEKTLDFSSKGPQPYVQHILKLSIDPITMEGFIHFDGYYYVEDTDLPKIHTMSYRHYAMEPCKTSYNGWRRCACLEALDADIEIYRHETMEDTSTFWTERMEDGDEIDMCLFPTKKQKLFFRIVEILKDDRMGQDTPPSDEK